MPDITFLKEGLFSIDLLQSYEKMGYKTETDYGMKYSEAMGILVDKKNNVLYRKVDPRSPDGSAAGY